MKTIKQHLEDNLPKEIAEKAIKYASEILTVHNRREFKEALIQAFNWEETTEGFLYWSDINKRYFESSSPVSAPQSDSVIINEPSNYKRIEYYIMFRVSGYTGGLLYFNGFIADNIQFTADSHVCEKMSLQDALKAYDKAKESVDLNIVQVELTETVL